MKRAWIVCSVAACVSAAMAAGQALNAEEAANPGPAAPAEVATAPVNAANPLQTEAHRVSYAIGLNIGSNLAEQGIEIDSTLLARGIADALENKQPLMSDEEIAATMQALQQRLIAEHMEKMQKASADNMAQGQSFLDQNKSAQGVQTTASGLQYKVEKQGEGPTPKATDTVRVHYRGTLVDNTEFDSSYKRGEPAVFRVDGVIPGWTEALQLMNVGSKYRLFIPPNLAYGARGAGDVIGPNSTLLFEVELLGIEPAEQHHEGDGHQH